MSISLHACVYRSRQLSGRSNTYCRWIYLMLEFTWQLVSGFSSFSSSSSTKSSTCICPFKIKNNTKALLHPSIVRTALLHYLMWKSGVHSVYVKAAQVLRCTFGDVVILRLAVRYGRWFSIQSHNNRDIKTSIIFALKHFCRCIQTETSTMFIPPPERSKWTWATIPNNDFNGQYSNHNTLYVTVKLFIRDLFG